MRGRYSARTSRATLSGVARGRARCPSRPSLLHPPASPLDSAATQRRPSRTRTFGSFKRRVRDPDECAIPPLTHYLFAPRAPAPCAARLPAGLRAAGAARDCPRRPRSAHPRSGAAHDPRLCGGTPAPMPSEYRSRRPFLASRHGDAASLGRQMDSLGMGRGGAVGATCIVAAAP